MEKTGKSLHLSIEGHPWRVVLFVGTPIAASALANNIGGFFPHLTAALVTAVFLGSAIAALVSFRAGDR